MSNLAQAGVAQGKKVASIAKLKADNMAQQDAIRKAYFAIGKAYYAKMQGQPDEEFAELCGKVDAIIFTGSLARDKYIIPYCRERIGFLGPIEVIPGEMEMEALAAGALRVLNGEEQAKEFNVLPEGFSTKEEFDAFVKTQQ